MDSLWLGCRRLQENIKSRYYRKRNDEGFTRGAWHGCTGILGASPLLRETDGILSDPCVIYNSTYQKEIKI